MFIYCNIDEAHASTNGVPIYIYIPGIISLFQSYKNILLIVQLKKLVKEIKWEGEWIAKDNTSV